MRLACPFCGERDASEFTYLGDAAPVRPDAADGDARALHDSFHDYVYLRDNVAGVMREWWYHSGGCRVWLTVERDTRTHEIHTVEPAPGATAAVKAGRGER
ncbi:MAG: sarcosine oxidase subunit delta [Rhizobiaceae bacterium]